MATIVEHTRHEWTTRAKKPYCRVCLIGQYEWMKSMVTKIRSSRLMTLDSYRYQDILDEHLDEWLNPSMTWWWEPKNPKTR